MSRPVTVALAVVLALVGAGCGTGGLPSASTGTPPGSAGPRPTATATPTPTPTPVEPSADPASTVPPAATSTPEPSSEPASATTAAPPRAMLTASGTPAGGVPAGGVPAGELGTYTWDGAGSEAPWLVPRAGAAIAPRSTISVSFDPDLVPSTWVARWAAVTGDQAGEVVAGVDGDGPVTLDGPSRAGTWSLQLEARFGDGRSATWYWRVTVGG